jgi:hypothetical protein
MEYKDVKFEHKLHSEKYIIFRKRLSLSLLAIPSLIFILGAFVFSDSENSAVRDHIGFLTFMCAIAILMLTVMVLFSLIEKLDDEHDGFSWEWLSADYCDDLLNLCRNQPDLDDYRQRVIAEGRRFTWAEYVAMSRWPEQKRKIQANLIEQKNRDAKCKALYES